MNCRPSLVQLLIGTFVHNVPSAEAQKCLTLIESHGLSITYKDLSAHHLAGGRISSWVEGLIYAQNRGIRMCIPNAAARDLVEAHTSKRTLREHVQAFEGRGIRDLDGAPLDVALLEMTSQTPKVNKQIEN